MQWLFDENNHLHMAGYWYLCNKTTEKYDFFTLHVFYASRLPDNHMTCIAVNQPISY